MAGVVCACFFSFFRVVNFGWLVFILGSLLGLERLGGRGNGIRLLKWIGAGGNLNLNGIGWSSSGSKGECCRILNPEWIARFGFSLLILIANAVLIGFVMPLLHLLWFQMAVVFEFVIYYDEWRQLAACMWTLHISKCFVQSGPHSWEWGLERRCEWWRMVNGRSEVERDFKTCH